MYTLVGYTLNMNKSEHLQVRRLGDISTTDQLKFDTAESVVIN